MGASPQVTDFNPGVEANGLFWTIPIAPGMVDIDPATGSARFVGRNLPVPDYGKFENSLGGGSSIPSRVDFEVTWTGNGPPQHIVDATFNFAGDYVPASATITFSASHDHGDVVYSSDPNPRTQFNPFPPSWGPSETGSSGLRRRSRSGRYGGASCRASPPSIRS